MSFDGVDTDFCLEAEPFGPLDLMYSRARHRAADAVHAVPLVANAEVLCASEVIDSVAAAWVALGRHPLIVDAAASAPAAPPASVLGLRGCVQSLSAHLSYLPAGGLARRYVDAQGSAARLLTEAQQAAPYADLVIVHAEAADLARIFKGRQAQPLLMAVDEPESLKLAYASWKWLGLRCGWVNARLVVAQASAERAEHIARTLAACAEQFMDAALVGWAALEPSHAAGSSPSRRSAGRNSASLLQLAAAHHFQEPNVLHGA